MNDTFVAIAGCPRLVGVYPRYENQLIIYLFIDFGKPCDIFTHSVLVVGRTRTDNDEKFVRFPGKYFTYFLISCVLQCLHLIRDWILFPDLVRRRQFFYKLKTHLLDSFRR